MAPGGGGVGVASGGQGGPCVLFCLCFHNAHRLGLWGRCQDSSGSSSVRSLATEGELEGPGSTLPIRAGPKSHHFLWACESLICSRQKAPMRKLFGKLKGSGRSGQPLQLCCHLCVLWAHPGPQRAAHRHGCSPGPGAVIPQAQKTACCLCWGDAGCPAALDPSVPMWGQQSPCPSFPL